MQSETAGRGVKMAAVMMAAVTVVALAGATAFIGREAGAQSSQGAQQAGGGAVWADIGRILKTADTPAAGYHRYNFPRRDLTVRMGDVTVATSMAFGSWAGFAGAPADAMMMGDLVLKPSELKAAQAEMATQGIRIDAVHNHLTGELPEVIYMHYSAHGAAGDLATKLDRVLAHTATPRPVTAAAPAPVTIDTATVFRMLGASGRAQGNVAQVSFMLVKGAVTMSGMPLVPAMAYGSPVNVQAVSASRFVTTGDFAVVAEQLHPLVHALATHGIAVTAVHSHMVGDSPHLYYVHFWGDGTPASVLGGIRAAVDAAR